jgi:hypothetical protein
MSRRASITLYSPTDDQPPPRQPDSALQLQCDFETPGPELLHAIVTGNHCNLNLRRADTYEPYAR